MHRQGRLDDAERGYRAALQIDGDCIGAMAGLGALCLQTGRNEEAVRWFRQAAERDAVTAWRQYDLAVALASSGLIDAAADAYRRAIALDPAAVMPRRNLGKLFYDAGRKEEALAAFQDVVAIEADSPDANICLGDVLMNLARHEEALLYLQKAVALAPQHPQPYYNLGLVLLELDRKADAVKAFEKALTLKPYFSGALEILGRTYNELDLPKNALQCYERLLALQPGSATAHNNYGVMLTRLERHEDAVAHFLKALTIHPGSSPVAVNLGNSLNALDRTAEALAAFERASAADPANAQAQLGIGDTLQILGRIEDANRAYEQAVALDPRAPVYYYYLTKAKKVRAGDPIVAALEDLAKDEASFADADRSYLHFALAKVYHDLERFARSFEHLAKGNEIKRRTIAYDEPATLNALRAAASIFTPEVMRAKDGLGNPSEVPVFIVGVPRSGTTLIEQILASHPQVFGAGELTDFRDIAYGGYRDWPPSFDVAKISASDLMRLGGRYLARIVSKAPEAKRIVDKMPANFHLAGFIHLMLPKARIIHVRRDPLDTCFSCYSILFRYGLGYAYDLGELGRYYKAYEALMAHWRTVLPEETMLEVRYEKLIGDFEAEVRRIVAFCGLPWMSAASNSMRPNGR